MGRIKMGMLVCSNCGEEYSLNEPIWKCKKCGGVLNIKFTAEFPLSKIKERKPTMWRYKEAIPLQNVENNVSFNEGYTPIEEMDFNGNSVQMKQEFLFPTGSFKDRGASVLVSKINNLGVKHVVEDSSGNAGCAIAAYTTKADITCEIFVPKTTPAGKLVQIRTYDAKLTKVKGDRKATAKAALKAAEKHYYASHSWNPFFLHGTKTFAFEVCEQRDWHAPDHVVLPVGNGTLLLGTYIGFQDLYNASIIQKMPRIIAIQSEHCNPLSQMFEKRLAQVPDIKPRKTLAEGIAIVNPIRAQQIIAAVEKTDGEFINISEESIKTALEEMGKRGYYIEPTAAATIAGIKKLGEEYVGEEIVSVFSGHGLKATQKILEIL